VIAAHENRNGAGARERIGAFAEETNPGFHFVIIFGVRGRRTVRSDHRPRDVAKILDAKFQLFEQASNAGGAQRVRPHQRAGLRGADLDGHAEQGDARLVRFVDVRHEAPNGGCGLLFPTP